MSGNVKKWINRGGLFAVVVGIVLIKVGGGDAAAAIETAGTVSAIAGAAIVFLRELFA